MRVLGLAARGAALACAAVMVGCSPAPVEKCPAFSIDQDIGKPSAGKVTFTLSPTRDGLTYNWSTAAGSIVEGQGTPKIVVEDSTPGDMVTVTAEVGGLDASCPNESRYVASVATMPP